jgi:hypothetical protein
VVAHRPIRRVPSLSAACTGHQRKKVVFLRSNEPPETIVSFGRAIFIPLRSLRLLSPPSALFFAVPTTDSHAALLLSLPEEAGFSHPLRRSKTLDQSENPGALRWVRIPGRRWGFASPASAAGSAMTTRR